MPSAVAAPGPLCSFGRTDTSPPAAGRTGCSPCWATCGTCPAPARSAGPARPPGPWPRPGDARSLVAALAYAVQQDRGADRDVERVGPAVHRYGDLVRG